MLNTTSKCLAQVVSVLTSVELGRAFPVRVRSTMIGLGGFLMLAPMPLYPILIETLSSKSQHYVTAVTIGVFLYGFLGALFFPTTKKDDQSKSHKKTDQSKEPKKTDSADVHEKDDPSNEEESEVSSSDESEESSSYESDESTDDEKIDSHYEGKNANESGNAAHLKNMEKDHNKLKNTKKLRSRNCCEP